MKEQAAVQNLLQTRFSELKRKNPSFSVRAFALKVGLNSGALSSILNGKRNVSESLARRIAERLLLDPQERSELLSLFPPKRSYRGKNSEETTDPNYLQLSAAQFRIVGEWEHFAILTLMRGSAFRSDPKWISKKLKLTLPKTEQAIARLISVGILRKTSDGKLERIPQKFRTTDDVVDLSVRRSHEETLDLAKDSLARDSIDVRDFTHLTLAFDPKNLSMAKELIRKFQDEFAKLVEMGNQTEVYRLSMQLFPLSDLKMEMQNEK